MKTVNHLRRWRRAVSRSVLEVCRPQRYARSSHQAVAVGQSVYILFGKGAAGSALSDIWRYNVTTNAWEQRASSGSPLPAGRFDFMAAPYSSGRITIYGDCTSDGVFADANAWNYTTPG